MKTKILNELSELVEQHVISEDIAHNINNYYKNKERSQPNRLVTVFGVLGSVLVGLGIILIVAHNWDSFSKTIKTCFAFLPLIFGQMVTGYTLLKSKSQSWKESSGTFLFFAIGACIAMISQIYNIPGNLGNYLLTWTILGLPLIYALNSKALVILSIVFATYYGWEVGYDFSSDSLAPWWYFILIAATLPFYIKRLKSNPNENVIAVTNWLYTLSLTVVLGGFINDNWPLAFVCYAMLFGLFYNLGKIKPFNRLMLRQNSYAVLGSLGMIVVFVLLTFNALWKEMLREDIAIMSQEWWLSMILFSLALFILIHSKKDQLNKQFNLFQYAFICFAIIFTIGGTTPGVGAILSNLFVVALGLFAIKIGADTYRFSILNYGLLIISTVIVCRFFDTNISFVWRGVLFVLVGIGFFTANYMMLKRQKSKL